jgi:hypothetical protein
LDESRPQQESSAETTAETTAIVDLGWQRRVPSSL